MHIWDDMDSYLIDKFYWPHPEVTSVYLINLKQQVGESASNFIERFMKRKENIMTNSFMLSMHQ